MKYIKTLLILITVCFFTSEVEAATIPLTGLQYTLYKSAIDVKSQLNETGKITVSEAKKIIDGNILVKPDMFTFEGKTTISTGSNGLAEFTLPQKNYRLNVKPVSGYDIAIPSEVYINKSPFIIAIGISQGSGQVNKKAAANGILASISNFFSFNAYAQGQAASTPQPEIEVKVVTYYDKNRNQRWDRSEDIIPWAGVALELTDSAAQSPVKSFFERVPFFKIQMGPSGN